MVGAAVGIAAVQWSCFVDRKTESYQCTSHATCIPMGRVCEQGYCVIDPSVKLDAAADAYIPDSPMCPLVCNGGCTYNGPTWTCTINGPVTNPTCPPNYHCAINCSDTAQCSGVIACATPSCDITCMRDNSCGAISCSGAGCSIHCTTSLTGSACGNITCSAGNCDSTCSGSAACGNLACSGTASCTETCSGSNACGDITCTNASACDVTCNSGAPACGNLTCGTGKCTESCTGTGACGFQMCQNSCNCNTTCSPLNACGVMTCPMPQANKYCATGNTLGNPCDSAAFPQCKSCP